MRILTGCYDAIKHVIEAKYTKLHAYGSLHNKAKTPRYQYVEQITIK